MVLGLHALQIQSNPYDSHKLCPMFHSISISIWISTPLKGSSVNANRFTHVSPINFDSTLVIAFLSAESFNGQYIHTYVHSCRW